MIRSPLAQWNDSPFSCFPTGPLLRAHPYTYYGNRSQSTEYSREWVRSTKALYAVHGVLIIIVVRSTIYYICTPYVPCMMYTSFRGKSAHWAKLAYQVPTFCILKYELWIVPGTFQASSIQTSETDFARVNSPLDSIIFKLLIGHLARKWPLV